MVCLYISDKDLSINDSFISILPVDSKAKFFPNPKFYATWIPTDSLQPWALSQPEPFLCHIIIYTSFSMSFYFFWGTQAYKKNTKICL